MKKIRLLLIEDNRILRDGIISILKLHKNIDIIAASEDNSITLMKIHRLKPNIILLDMGLRRQSSLHIVEIMKKEFRHAKIIVMDLAPVDADILKYVKAGVNGFILKDSSKDELLKTIEMVSKGATVFPSPSDDSLFSQIVAYGLTEDKSKINRAMRITKRELKILELLNDGLNNKEISQKIHISIPGVKNHIDNIIEKLALHKRLEIENHSNTGEILKTISQSISTINN